jgi:hypothetical protein
MILKIQQADADASQFGFSASELDQESESEFDQEAASEDSEAASNEDF